jgi:hypothetical protein
MDNFSETSKKTGRLLNPVKRPKPDRRWTLLFIGNRGRTITLKRFKGMVLLTLIVLCISIVITVGLLFLSLNIRQEKVQLESRVKALKEQIKTLHYEKDVLMTRLVLAESRSKEIPGKIQEKPEEPAPAAAAESNSEKPKQPIEETVSREAAPVPEQSEPEEVAGQSDTKLSVALENFQISPKPDENLLRFQFKIKNTSANAQRVSGHTLVVLKGDRISQERWMTIPAVPLVDGKPTGRQTGHSFGINYFKTMRFSSNYPKFPDEYQVATVYVFTHQGELLLEEDFPVKLPAAFHEAPEASPASDEKTPPSAAPAASADAPSSTDVLMNTQPNANTP